MPIALRSALGSANAGASTIVMDMPAGVVNNDVLVMLLSVRGGTGTTITTPSGWTLLATAIDSGTTLRQALFWRIASSEPGSYTVNITSAKAAGVIIAISGADTTQPVAAQFAGQANASSATVASPALGSWTSIPGMDLFLGGTATGTTAGAPTNYTLAGEEVATGGPASGKVTAGLSYRVLGAVTTVGAISATFGAAAINIGHHLFIKEGAFALTQPLSDSVTATDDTSRASATKRTLSDSVTLSDTPTAAIPIAHTKPLSDSVSVADIASPALAYEYTKDLTDTVTLSDTPTFNIGTPGSQSLSDTVIVEDVCTPTLTIGLGPVTTLNTPNNTVFATPFPQIQVTPTDANANSIVHIYMGWAFGPQITGYSSVNGVSVDELTKDIFFSVSDGHNDYWNYPQLGLWKQTGGVGPVTRIGFAEAHWREIKVNSVTKDVWAWIDSGQVGIQRGMWKQPGGTGDFVWHSYPTGSIRDIAIDTTTGDVFISTGSTMWKLTGGVGNWVNEDITGFDPIAVAVDSSNQDLYTTHYTNFGGYSKGVYKKTGGIGDWVLIPNSPINAETYGGLAVNSVTKDLFVCTDTGIYYQQGGSGLFQLLDNSNTVDSLSLDIDTLTGNIVASAGSAVYQTGVSKYDYYSNLSGWSDNFSPPVGSQYPSGTLVTFTFDALAPGTYPYRARSQEYAGGNLWGDYTEVRYFTVVPTHTKALTEGVTANDAIAFNRKLNFVDGVPLIDSLTGVSSTGSNTFIFGIADTITGIDDTSKRIRARRGFDSVTTSDSIIDLLHTIGSGGGTDLTTNLTDSVSLTDSIEFLKTIFRDLADTVTLTDELAKALQAFQEDTVIVTDTITKTPVITLSDIATLAEALTASRAIVSQQADSATATDELSKSIVLDKSDNATLADETALSRAIVLQQADIVTVTDALSKHGVFVIGDTTTLTDGFTKNTSFNLSDVAVFADSVTKNLVLNKGDIIVVSENIVTTLGDDQVYIKCWTGSAWINGILKTWNGSAWVGVLKRWNGSSWVDI